MDRVSEQSVTRTLGAVHEAGHAVAGLLLGLSMRPAKLPAERYGCSGPHLTPGFDAQDAVSRPGLRQHADSRVQAASAGAMAELLWAELNVADSTWRLELVAETVQRSTADFRAEQAIAEAMMGKGAPELPMYTQAQRELAKILARQAWGSIMAVAEALLERQTIDAVDLVGLIRAGAERPVEPGAFMDDAKTWEYVPPAGGKN